MPSSVNGNIDILEMVSSDKTCSMATLLEIDAQISVTVKIDILEMPHSSVYTASPAQRVF